MTKEEIEITKAMYWTLDQLTYNTDLHKNILRIQPLILELKEDLETNKDS